jgi:hypothetical protein
VVAFSGSLDCPGNIKQLYSTTRVFSTPRTVIYGNTNDILFVPDCQVVGARALGLAFSESSSSGYGDLFQHAAQVLSKLYTN